MKAITETWTSLEEEDSDGDICEEEKNDEDEDTDIESEEEIEEIFELPDTTVKEKENSSKLTCREVNMTNVWNKGSKKPQSCPNADGFYAKVQRKLHK